MSVAAPVRKISFITFLIVSFSAVAENTLEAEPVIVTATRTTQTVDNSLASVQVIGSQEIKQGGQTGNKDLL